MLDSHVTIVITGRRSNGRWPMRTVPRPTARNERKAGRCIYNSSVLFVLVQAISDGHLRQFVSHHLTIVKIPPLLQHCIVRNISLPTRGTISLSTTYSAAMAMIGRNSVHHIRSTNKEPEWSSICNNVLDQYLDDDDIFGFGTEQRGRSSSDDSVNLFDFSGSSEQSSNPTSGTSPIPSWEPAQRTAPEAQQPKAKVPLDFWHKKLRALEQHAAASEQDQSHKLRSTKSHPDFLSLGGYPSPPAIPVSSGDQSFSVPRQRSRVAANGKQTTTQRSVTSRSVSRGRPTGVSKPSVAGAAANPSVRKSSASPSKMMTPSRYRAGFKNVWADRIESSPKKYELRVPSHIFPASPPPSAKSIQDSFAAFGSPIAYSAVPGYDAKVSPLARSFQQARIHTPGTSPLLSPGSNVSPSYFEQPPTENPYVTQTLPLNDTAPLYPERTDSLAAASKIQTFDFGFSNSDDDPWSRTSYEEPSSAVYSTGPFKNHDPFGTLNHNAMPTSDHLDLGLGISCDPNHLVANYQSNTTVPTSAENSNYNELTSPYYVPSLPNGLPNTKYHRTGSDSPPPPQSESRSRRTSASRQTSRHRRTKSTNSTARLPNSPDKGGFVNYTPQDHNKILSGVAPSGSSKTKARREKEALDKRRRLSQAAYAAVLAAGGSMEQLTKAGLVGDLAY